MKAKKNKVKDTGKIFKGPTNRHTYNQLILEELQILIDRYQDQRFGQIMENYFPHLDFFVESKETYDDLVS